MTNKTLCHFFKVLCIGLLSSLFFLDPSLAQRVISSGSKSGGDSVSGQSGGGSSAATLKMTGTATLVSNFVMHGLTQSNGDPALQGSYMFNFGPQLKLGLWGSNVSFAEDVDHFNLRFIGEIKVDFSQDVDAYLTYSSNRYYKSSIRDGSTLGFLLQLYKFQFGIDHESNWQGSATTSDHFLFGYPWEFSQGFNWQNDIGYNQITAANYSSYIDWRSTLAYQGSPILYQLIFTYNASAGQFGDQGKNFFIFSISTDF